MRFLFIFALAFAAWGRTKITSVYHPPTYTIPEKEWELEFQGTAYTSQYLYDIDGLKDNYDGSEGYERFDDELHIRFGISDRLQLGLNGVYRDNKSIDAVNSEITRRGVESVAASLRYQVYSKNDFRFSLETELRHIIADAVPTDYQDDKIELSDEGSPFKIGGAVSAKFWDEVFLNLQSFYSRPGNSQSDEVAYDASLAWIPGRFGLSTGTRGVRSFKTDSFTDNPLDKPSKATGSTNTINSINRYYQEGYVNAHFAITDNWRIMAGAGKTINGRSWDKRSFGTLSLAYQSGSRKPLKGIIETFKTYEFEASVTKVSPRGKFIQIDMGLSDDLQTKMPVDIFEINYLGGNTLIGKGVIHEVTISTAVVKILAIFDEKKPIKQGNLVRGKR